MWRWIFLMNLKSTVNNQQHELWLCSFLAGWQKAKQGGLLAIFPTITEVPAIKKIAPVTAIIVAHAASRLACCLLFWSMDCDGVVMPLFLQCCHFGRPHEMKCRFLALSLTDPFSKITIFGARKCHCHVDGRLRRKNKKPVFKKIVAEWMVPESPTQKGSCFFFAREQPTWQTKEKRESR